MGSALAIDGGTAVVPSGTVRTWPEFTDSDRAAVLRVFANNQLHTNAAPFAQELQAKWAEYCGVKHCLVTNGGTGALHIALAAAGVRAGDEVITSAYSYWATAASILHQNAIPVFADVDPQTTTIDPARIEEMITDQTTAILPVDIHGVPADMDAVRAVAQKHGLLVVSDCCQAHGAAYKGQRVGGLADISGFSLNRSKNLTGGEGGLVTTSSDEHQRRCEAILRFQNVEDDEGTVAFSGLGFNYRPHEFVNALALSQLERLPTLNERRKEMAGYLTQSLTELAGVAGPRVPEYADPVYFSYLWEARPDELGLDVPAGTLRKGLCRALAAEGVPARPAQPRPVPGEGVFQAKLGYGRGCPWRCHAREVTYRVEDYPSTLKVCTSRAFLGGVYPPNDLNLMTHYVEAFAKVLGQIDRVLELAEEE
ncbi:MAG: DegT/DnrJ/EryC1/StrS family aminotransferase [Armatimonadetes bacterium]|nr:DegT/DnrJ/EryC1/StrS family aminotransferase [Armatimonadota bacterium]